MAGTVDTRKRSREEEQNEFMPLSKRINNLHLNNNQNSIGGVLPEHGVGMSHHAVGPIQQHDCVNHPNHHLLGSAGPCAISFHNNNHLIGVVAAGNSNSSSSSSSSNGSSHGGSLRIPANSGSNSPASTVSINGEIFGDYCPVLTAEENPHYFTKNKILYELYVERMSRLQ